MEILTKVAIPKSNFSISYHSRLVLLGSCFVENIGLIMKESKFNLDLNPFGILYNPLSITKSLSRLVDNRLCSANDLVHYNGLYHSFDYHGKYSNTDEADMLNIINEQLHTSRDNLLNADVLIITLGTSFIYRLKDTNQVVSNCHKMPANMFQRSMLTVNDIVQDFRSFFAKFQRINPNCRILFTVSPIRHLHDGAHENQLSKSTLLLAINELANEFKEISYFPSYEIMLDELRDYRFYNDDMIHPSKKAIEYIWERFCEAFLLKETISIQKEWKDLSRALNHRPINNNTIKYHDFLKQTLLKIQRFESKYPYICCKKEIDILLEKMPGK